MISIPVIITTFFALISILNPLTTIPYYFLLHPESEYKETKKDGIRIGFVVFLVLLASFLFGSFLLDFLNLKLPYFKIGGGIVLFLMSLSMIRGEMSNIKINDNESSKLKNDYIEKGLIIPLSIPLTSGPGSIAYIISTHGIGYLNGFLAIFFHP